MTAAAPTQPYSRDEWAAQLTAAAPADRRRVALSMMGTLGNARVLRCATHDGPRQALRTPSDAYRHLQASGGTCTLTGGGA